MGKPSENASWRRGTRGAGGDDSDGGGSVGGGGEGGGDGGGGDTGPELTPAVAA